MQWCVECGAEHADWVEACSLCGSPLVDHPLGPLDSAEGANAQAAAHLSTTARRVAAELVGALLWVVALALLGLLARGAELPAAVSSVAGFLLFLVVDVTLIARTGADPGKFLLRLRVVDANDRWPTWMQALQRTAVLYGAFWALGLATAYALESSPPLGLLLAAARLLWVGLIVWSIASDPQRQGWHDRIADTWVIERPANG